MLENFLHKLGNTAGLSSTTETEAIMEDTIDTFANKSAILLENFLHELGKAARLAGDNETKAISEELGLKLGW